MLYTSNALVLAVLYAYNLLQCTLRKSLNEFYIPHGNVYKLKFEWEENHIPTISEIITLTDDEYKSECAKD